MELDEVQRHLLDLVKEGKIFATARIGENGRRIFVDFEHATSKDIEFTLAWVKDPHFGVQ